MNGGRSVLRVAVVGPYPLDHRGPNGGIEAVSRDLVEGVRRTGEAEVHVITVDFGATPSTTADHVHALKSHQAASQLTLYRRERRWLAHTVADVAPDVVHVHGTNFYGAAANEWNVPTVVTVHGLLAREAKVVQRGVPLPYRLYRRTKSRMNQWMERRTLRAVRHLIVISPYVAEAVKASDERQVYAIANPVDDAFFALHDHSVANRVLFLGVMSARKGVLQLIAAIDDLRRRVPDVELHIVGPVQSREYDAAVRSEVRARALDRHVVFRGRLADDEVRAELAQARLLVLPSQEETAPTVVGQAMAAATPVVATRVGGVAHLVEHGGSGLLVQFGDVASLADAMHTVLADATLARRMGDRGREIALERFALDEISRQTLDVYRRVAEARHDDIVSAPQARRPIS